MHGWPPEPDPAAALQCHRHVCVAVTPAPPFNLPVVANSNLKYV